MTTKQTHRPYYICLAVGLFLLLCFLVGRNFHQGVTYFVDYVTQPVKQAVASVTYLFPFAVAELLYVLIALGIVFHIVRCAVKARQAGKGNRRDVVYRGFLGLLCFGVFFLDWFLLVWGINYYAAGFQERSGLYAREVTVEELTRVTALFVEELNKASQEIPRDENGLFDVPQEEIFEDSVKVYDGLYEEFPFLYMKDRVPKKMTASRLLSAMGFTGYYAGYTGESVLNVDAPACLLPSTIAHELGHQRGIASEQECNFLAVIASTKCDIPSYVYSGYLLGYIHLSNALYKADREAWETLRGQLSPEVLPDIQYNNAYWQQWESPVEAVSKSIYDTVLKANGQEDGLQSYGTVVDLLVAYY